MPPPAQSRNQSVAVKPGDTRTVSAILKYADRKRLPVTVRGGGAGLSGGAIPAPGRICLSLKKIKTAPDPGNILNPGKLFDC